MAAVTNTKTGVIRGWAVGTGTTGDGQAPTVKAGLDGNFLRTVAGTTRFVVISHSLTAAPGSPVDGDCYLVATGATGAWSGKAGNIAIFDSVNTAWVFIPPYDGFEAFSQADDKTRQYDGSAWQEQAGNAVPINTQTGTSYTLALTDAGACVRMSNASANTLTVPANATVAFPIGTQTAVRQVGTGKTSVAAAGGVTINSPDGILGCRTRYSMLVLLKVGTNEWDLSGDAE